MANFTSGAFGLILVILAAPMCTPDNVTEVCPPGHFCPYHELDPVPCSPGYYCPANSSNEVLCPAGSYCPTSSNGTHGTVAIPCPSGYYCLEGTVQPHAYCPPGSHRQDWWLLSSIDIIVIASAFILFSMLRTRLWRAKAFQALNFAFRDRNRGEEARLLSFTTPGELPTLDVKFRDLEVEHGKRLQSVSGAFCTGRVCAILGGSGAGKSTFVDAILGNQKITSGTIVVNGTALVGEGYSPLRKIRRNISYVPQDPPLSNNLSVRESVASMCNLRISRDISQAGRAEIVDQAIEQTGLKHVQHNLVNELSGGQRRRVGLAEGISFSPLLCVFDEPTSGLDSETALDMLHAMRKIADMGVAVITVLHSPTLEMLACIDDILFIAADFELEAGKSVYFGPANNLRHRLELCSLPDMTFNPNQIERLFNSIGGTMNEEKRSRMRKLRLVHEEIDGPTILSEPPQPLPVHRKQTIWSQLQTCLIRELRKRVRNPWGIAITLALHVITGVFLGIAATSSQYIGPLPPELQRYCPAAMGTICHAPISNPVETMAVLLMLGVSIAATCTACGTFGGIEWVLYQKDERGGVSLLPFFLSKVAIDAPRLLICPLMILGPFFEIGIVTGSFHDYYVLLVGVEMCAYGTSYIVSLLLPLRNHVLVGVVLSMCLCLLSGISPTLPWVEANLPMLYPLWNLSYVRWAAEAVTLIETKYYASSFDVSSGFRYLGYKSSDLGLCFGLVFGFATFFYCLAFGLLATSRVIQWLKRKGFTSTRFHAYWIQFQQRCRRRKYSLQQKDMDDAFELISTASKTQSRPVDPES